MLKMQAHIQQRFYPLPILQVEKRKQGGEMKDYDEMKDYRTEFLNMTPDEQDAIWEKCGQLQVSPALVLYIEELESRLAALESSNLMGQPSHGCDTCNALTCAGCPMQEITKRLAALEAAQAEDERQTAEYKAPDRLTQSSK